MSLARKFVALATARLLVNRSPLVVHKRCRSVVGVSNLRLMYKRGRDHNALQYEPSKRSDHLEW